MRSRLLLAAALAISPTLLIGQEVSLADWRVCAGVEDSLERLTCFENLAVGVSSSEWRACSEVEDHRARLTCYDNLAIEVSSAEWRVCAGTENYRGRLTCYDNLAMEVSSDESRDCAGIADSLERLTCFDDLTERMGEPEEPEEPGSDGEPDQPPAGGSWQLEEEVDPTSDRTTWIATLSPDKEQSYIGSTAVLALRCKDGELEIMVGVNEALADDTIIIRFDQDASEVQSWSSSTGKKFLFARADQMLWFLQELRSSNRLNIRVESDREGARTVIFPLNPEETKSVLDSIRGDCPTVGRGKKAARW